MLRMSRGPKCQRRGWQAFKVEAGVFNRGCGDNVNYGTG